MKLGPALARLHEAELDLADDFRRIGERHAADHDVHHVAHSLAEQCEQHAAKLEPVAGRYGSQVDGDHGPEPWRGLLESVRHKSSELLGRRPESGLLLLADLRRLYLAVVECGVLWVIAGQGAQAARDKELLELVRECHTDTEVQAKWLLTRIKVATPQVLMS